jgi:hypothetical protein
MLELLPFMFKRPTARTRPAECEFNYEEMGKPSLLVDRKIKQPIKYLSMPASNIV